SPRTRVDQAPAFLANAATALALPNDWPRRPRQSARAHFVDFRGDLLGVLVLLVPAADEVVALLAQTAHDQVPSFLARLHVLHQERVPLLVGRRDLVNAGQALAQFAPGGEDLPLDGVDQLL